MHKSCYHLLLGSAALAAPALLLASHSRAAQSEGQESRPPVKLELAEARRMVHLMNDIYVAGVLTAHDMYVREPGNPAAVTWGKQVIRQIRAKGWPDAHIFDTTGRPLNPENSPRNAFERDAVVAFKNGRPAVEKVDGRVFRYATSIRIADQSCLGCHVRAKVGDLVGGVSYAAELQDPKR